MHPFHELYSALPRQGPGSTASTRQALECLQVPSEADVLDIGCGSGAQTAVLAERADLRITAVDSFAPSLARLGARLPGVRTLQASMSDLPLPDAAFDAIWSEGAIYIIGFSTGLAAWRRLLRPGGCVAVTELSWLTPTPSAEPAAAWGADYPAMQTVSGNIATIERLGYALVDTFVLPERDWWTDYYGPLRARIEALAPTWSADEQRRGVLAEARREIALFERYSREYGYVFYLMRDAGGHRG